MIIHKIIPQGYCNGVKRALDIVYKEIENPHTIKPVYLLGHIIHNKHVVNDLKKRGVILIENKDKSRLELLDEISCGTVVLSAHGVSPSVYEKAQKKGLQIIDATCGNVLIIQKKIKHYLNLGYDCIYIGTKNHPECEGVLGISNSIHFIASLEDIKKLNITNSKVYITNQTTLSKYDVQEYFELLKQLYPLCIIDDKICNATTIRQEAMAKQKKVDLCIVVGDALSSNTKKLAKVSKEIAKINTILCEDLKDLDISLCKKASSISISSGASTPEYIVDEIVQYLKEL